MTDLKLTKNISLFRVTGFITMLMVALFSSVITLQAQVVPHNLLPPKPDPARLVNDYADLLTPDEERQLERKLVAYDDSTTNQILDSYR